MKTASVFKTRGQKIRQLKRQRGEEKSERKPQGVTHKDFGGAIRPWLNGIQQQAFH